MLSVYAGSLSVWGAEGEIWVEVTDILQRDLPAKVELVQQGSTEIRSIQVPEGKGIYKCPPGQYKALVYVYDQDVPVMVDVQEVVVETGIITNLIHEVVEGRLGRIPLREYDSDGDLALDRVEAVAGTDIYDPASYPGAMPIAWSSEVLSKKGDWYAGDLHVRSIHGGGGQQTVAELVARAESAGLDFLAITDRNTMASVSDPAYKSKKVVLVPAMEWGSNQRGIALIYGPRTLPRKSAGSSADAQGLCDRVQAQGGLFVVAHPCFPAQGEGGASTAPWQWGTSYVNAIEVWCRDWRNVPPIGLDAFIAEYHRRRGGKLIYSISRAATAATLSANGQAVMFWDYELTRGLRASLIAGSLSSSADVPLGQPVTYVFAKEKSVEGILEGLRLGRTFVTTRKDGPIIRFVADEGKNGTFDVNIGGIIPLNKETRFTIQAIGAKGAKLELLSNGRVISSHLITTSKVESLWHTVNPTAYTVYRARIVKTPEKSGFGPHEMLAMSGPIYAQNIVAVLADARFQIADLLLEKEHTLESLVAATKETEPRVIFHLQQLDNLGLLLARNEDGERLFRLDSSAYQYIDKSLLTVDDFWAPLRSSQTRQVSAPALRDSRGNSWVQPRAGTRVAPPIEPEWVPPTEFETLRPKEFGSKP